jgi:hypothetical protein
MSLSEKELIDLHAMAKRMSGVIKVRDRKHLLTTYESCFVGTEAVEWLQTTGAADSEKTALALGNQILEAGFIHHVLNEHKLENKALFYR